MWPIRYHCFPNKQKSNLVNGQGQIFGRMSETFACLQNLVILNASCQESFQLALDHVAVFPRGVRIILCLQCSIYPLFSCPSVFFFSLFSFPTLTCWSRYKWPGSWENLCFRAPMNYKRKICLCQSWVYLINRGLKIIIYYF